MINTRSISLSLCADVVDWRSRRHRWPGQRANQIKTHCLHDVFLYHSKSPGLCCGLHLSPYSGLKRLWGMLPPLHSCLMCAKHRLFDEKEVKIMIHFQSEYMTCDTEIQNKNKNKKGGHNKGSIKLDENFSGCVSNGGDLCTTYHFTIQLLPNRIRYETHHMRFLTQCSFFFADVPWPWLGTLPSVITGILVGCVPCRLTIFFLQHSWSMSTIEEACPIATRARYTGKGGE